jgi:citrate lyase subunit beta / citryl-CoA lyase
MTRPFRLRRSELSTPGTSDKMMAKAASSDADLVFLDLEDAVAPSEKPKARPAVVAALRELDWGNKTVAVRVNGAHTPWCHDDVIEVVTGAGDRLDLLILPKVKGPRDVWFFETLLGQLEEKLGLASGRIGLEVLIEETEALANVEAIAGCSSRLEALILGVGDLSASQGIRTGHVGESGGYPGDMWHYARNRMIVAARANGLDAVDGPFANFRNDAGYRKEAEWAATLGAVGKWAIHPSQVPLANEIFSPTADEAARARAVVDAVERAETAGEGAANLNGVMIDAATARIFRTVLDRVEAIEASTGGTRPPAS